MTGAAILFVASAVVVVWQNSRLTILWDASYILENADTLNPLEQQVADVWTQLVQEADARMAISV